MENPKIQSPSRCNKRTGRYTQANNPLSIPAYRAENVNLGNFEAVESIGNAFAPKQSSCQKVDDGMENPKMESPSLCNKRAGRYTQANNPVSSTAYTAENGNLGNFEAVEKNGTAFAPKQSLYQTVAKGMENPKMQSPSRYKKRTERYTQENNPFSCTAYRAENGNLGNFEGVENIITTFAPKQSLYPKVAEGIENPKIQAPSRWKKRIGRYTQAYNPVSCTAYMAENGNLGKFEAVENNGTAFAPKQSLYQKVAECMDNQKFNCLLGTVTHWALHPGK